MVNEVPSAAIRPRCCRTECILIMAEPAMCFHVMLYKGGLPLNSHFSVVSVPSTATTFCMDTEGASGKAIQDSHISSEITTRECADNVN